MADVEKHDISGPSIIGIIWRLCIDFILIIKATPVLGETIYRRVQGADVSARMIAVDMLLIGWLVWRGMEFGWRR